MTKSNQLDFFTRCVHAGQEPDPTTGAVMMPIYTTSTYVQQSPGVHKGYDYARTKNPTRMAFERCIADLEGGSAAFAFASGLAAISTTLECLDHGSHIVAVDDLYGGSRRLFERVRTRSMGSKPAISISAMPMRSKRRSGRTRAWSGSRRRPTRCSSWSISSASRRSPSGTASGRVADNTFASPYIQRPLEYGFDLVVHSTTKYLNGHSDMVGGVAIVGEQCRIERAHQVPAECGGRDPGPVRSFLALRGLKTLALRMERHCTSALKIADLARTSPQDTPGVLSRARKPSPARARQAGRCARSAA